MRAFIVGGTGFLGYHIVHSCLARGWKPTALGLPPAPPTALYPPTVRMLIRNVNEASDKALFGMLRGHDALVFAAGMDDQKTPRKPAYPKFYKANVEDLTRLLTLARDAGVRRAVVLGSYFTHLNRLRPDLRLAEHHPYIRSRVAQERATASIPGLDGIVLELPYVFGAVPIPGWRPLWTPLIHYFRRTPVVFYTEGGSACVSAGVVGRAVVAAIEHGQAGSRYPIGQENLDWSELLTRLARADGRSIRVVTLPAIVPRALFGAAWLTQFLQGKESGLDLLRFTDVQTMRSYIDSDASRRALGYELDDLDQAFRDTVAAAR